MKLLGLSDLASTLETIRKENETLQKQVKDLCDEVSALEEKVEEIEMPDMDEVVTTDDINGIIEDYLYQNDYADYDKVSELIDEMDTDSIVEKVVEEIEDDIEEKVRDLFNDASPCPMTEEDVRKEVRESVKVTLEKMVKAIAEQS